MRLMKETNANIVQPMYLIQQCVRNLLQNLASERMHHSASDAHTKTMVLLLNQPEVENRERWRSLGRLRLLLSTVMIV